MTQTLFYPSASGIETWLMCPARALAKYVGGHEEAPTPPMLEGTRLHKLTQTALVTGKLPGPEERAVHKIVAALPIPLGSIEPGEVERVLVLPGFFGFLDWATRDVRHGDLKFTSNVRNQQKKDPRRDAQRILYGLDAFYRDPYLVTSQQTWSVSQFNGARALRLDHVWTRKSVKSAYEKTLAKPVDKFREAVQAKQDWQTATKNYNSCDAYSPNGCHMKAKGCKRSLAQRLVTLKPGKIRIST